MTGLELVQIISAFGTILTGFLLPIILTRMTAAKEAALAAKDAAAIAAASAEGAKVTVGEVKAQTEIIHTQTNSNLSEVKEKLERNEARFEQFRKESDARDQELRDLILRLAERNSTLVDVPLTVKDQMAVDRISGHATPHPTTAQQVGEAIKNQVADGLSETLKDIQVDTIHTETITVAKEDEPPKKKEVKK